MKANTNASELKNKVKAAANELFKNLEDGSSSGTTHIVQLSRDGNFWAIVLAYMDYDNNGDYQVYGKVAYMPNNSAMAEYDIDWMMPYNEKTGEVEDTEVMVTPENLNVAANDLVSNWLRIYKELEEKEEYEAEMESKGGSDNRSLMTEERFSNLVMEYMITENCSLTEAIALAEDTITPDMLNRLEQTPAYRKMLKDIEYYFKAVDGVEGYRDGDFKDGPIDALQDEADFCKETANFLGSIRFKGFKPEVQKDLVNATMKDMEYLDRSALRLTNILKKQNDSMYLKKDGSVNVNTNQKPGEYARRALRKIRDLFARLGQKWDYDPDFDYASLPEVDYKNYVMDSKNRDFEWKNGIMNTVNTAMSEGVLDKKVLLAMGDDLKLNEEQKAYYTKYVYHMLG